MPKKSKMEKIMAEMRRDRLVPHQESTPVHATHELTLVKRDLTKTVILATIAIGVEVGLYIVMR